MNFTLEMYFILEMNYSGNISYTGTFICIEERLDMESKFPLYFSMIQQSYTANCFTLELYFTLEMNYMVENQ